MIQAERGNGGKVLQRNDQVAAPAAFSNNPPSAIPSAHPRQPGC